MAAKDPGAKLEALNNLLIDSGPAIALLNLRDPAHGWVADYTSKFTGQLHTTGAVITEAMHFAGATPAGPAFLSEFVTASGMRVHGFAQGPELRAAVFLMQRFADTPMDYADATLVLLADKIQVYDILTLDRRGFTVFRTPKRRSFNLVGQR